MIEITEAEFAALFAKYPAVRKAESGTPLCPYCSNALSPENLGFFNGATESGTGFCEIEITCDVCNRVIWEGASWYPGIDQKDELLEVTGEVLDMRIGEQP